MSTEVVRVVFDGEYDLLLPCASAHAEDLRGRSSVLTPYEAALFIAVVGPQAQMRNIELLHLRQP